MKYPDNRNFNLSQISSQDPPTQGSDQFLVFEGNGRASESSVKAKKGKRKGFGLSDAISLVQGVFPSAIPMGLSALLHNSDNNFIRPKRISEERLQAIREVRGRKNRLELLKSGLVTDDEVFAMFKDALERYSDFWTVFWRLGQDGNLLESKAVPSKSRWNLRHNSYQKSVAKKLGNEVKDLRNVVLMTLTYDLKKVENPYPFLDDETYVLLKCWEHLDEFLDRLRKYRERQGQKWNYITTVIEPQKRGVVHFHLIFFGTWVAPIPVLQRFWEWSEGQGVDVELVDNFNAVGYVVKYLSKAKSMCMVKGVDREISEVRKWYAWCYFFGIRFYNCRHHLRHLKVKSEWVCVGLAYVGQGEWSGKIDILFKRYDESYGQSEDKWWDDS